MNNLHLSRRKILDQAKIINDRTAQLLEDCDNDKPLDGHISY
jgi:hypothetical protein